MLQCIERLRGKKVAGLAGTYRAGSGSMLSTCPDSCSLKPKRTGTKEIDRDYEQALRDSVPRRGASFLFTHFRPSQWARPNSKGKAVFNYSADTLDEASREAKKTATVCVVPKKFWNGRPSSSFFKRGGVRFVRCMDEQNGRGCTDCGAGKPLCARESRDFVVVFTAHGAASGLVGSDDNPGGCYATGGNVRLHWDRLSKKEGQGESDAEKHRRFVQGLPPRTVVRCHIAGDMGRSTNALA